MTSPNSKLCYRCREVKPMDDFYSDRYREDGKACYCRPCSRAYARERAKLPHVKAVRRAWALSEKRKRATATYFAQPKNRNKKRAQVEVLSAVRRGELVPATACESCSGSELIEAHHDDYAHSLEVRWLCRWCHRAWHREHGPGRNSDLMVPRE